MRKEIHGLKINGIIPLVINESGLINTGYES